MDGQRFDAWTRLLARGISRRATLRSLTGVALAGITSRTAIREAEATFGECVEFGLPCSPGECCSGLACRAGFGSDAQTVCGSCLEPGAYCSSGECCSGSCSSKVHLFGAYTCDEAAGNHKGGKKKAKCDGNGCKKKKKHGKKHGHGKHGR
jgi:hypothetical protein